MALASDALSAQPALADRIDVAWVGGAVDPGAAEYNRETDPFAARYVLERCRVTSYPKEVYTSIAISVAELEQRLTTTEVGNWLWQRYLTLPLPDAAEVGPVWPLGDSAALASTALPHGTFEPATPTHTRCTGVDARLIIEDLFSRLILHSRQER